MRKMNSKITTKFISEAGAQLQNNDYFAFVELDHYAIYIIADGLDEEIDINSAKIAVSHIISNFSDKPNMRKKTLRKLLHSAHKELINESNDLKLKVTLTVVVTDYVKVRYAMAGNTRFTLYREGFFKYRSKDQSLTRRLVEDERLPLDKAMQHEERNNLFCYLGQEGRLSPYISKKLKLKDGDILLLLTKGVWENVAIDEIEESLSEAKEAGEVIDNIEELLLSKQPELLDNYTAATLFVDKTYRNPNKKKRIKLILAIGIPVTILVVALSIMLYTKHKKRESQLEDMTTAWKNADEYVGINNYVRANEEYGTALKVAQKLKLNEEKEDLDQYYKLTEMITQADKTFMDMKLMDALSAYQTAKKYAYDADLLGEAYVEEKVALVKEYLAVQDLIKEGEQAEEIKQNTEAIENYKAAKNKANDLGYVEGKKEAEEKLDQLISKIDENLKEEKATAEKQKEADDKQKEKEEAEQKVKEEEDKQKQAEADAKLKEKYDTQVNALDMTQKGNTCFELANYEDAKMYYLMAQEMFMTIENGDMVAQLEEKIQIANKKSLEVAKEKTKADAYLSDANIKYRQGKLEDAKMLYMFALEIYEQTDDQEKIDQTAEKIKLIEQLIEKESGQNTEN